MINLLVLTVSRREVLCYQGLREMRTGQQGWGAPWCTHTKTIPGALGSCRSVSICGDRRLLRVGVLPWDVGSVAVLVPDSGPCPGHTCVTMQCPLTAHNRWGQLPRRVWTATAFTGLSHVLEAWSPGVLPAGQPWAHRPAFLAL